MAGLGAGAAALVACGSGAASNVPTAGVAGSSSDGPQVLRYGSAPRQHIELTKPTDGTGPVPVVVLLHGGFWMSAYDLGLMRPLVPSLVAKGWAVANVEYRSVGDHGGGWPGTLDDAAAAIDALAGTEEVGLDVTRVVVLGHSAGGQLAVWLAGRHRLPSGAPGADPKVRPIGVVAEAGVLDLVAAADQGLGGGAVTALLDGSPSTVPDRYAIASPVARVPIGVPVVLVHGPDDGVVPLDQSTHYRDVATRAGEDVTLTEVPGDHFALIDPTTTAGAAALAAVSRLLAR